MKIPTPLMPNPITKAARISAVAFTAFIVAAMIIADRGEGESWWPFLHRIPFGDKTGHLFLFGTLAFLCHLAFPNFRSRNNYTR